MLALFEWRRMEDRVGGADRGEPERSSVLGEKRDEWESDVRIIDGRVSLRDLPRPRALVWYRVSLGECQNFRRRWG